MPLSGPAAYTLGSPRVGLVGGSLALARAADPPQVIQLQDADFKTLGEIENKLNAAQTTRDRELDAYLKDVAAKQGINTDCATRSCYRFDERRHYWELVAEPAPPPSTTTSTVP